MASTEAKRVDELVTEIRRLDHLYYVEAKPAVSDLQYDRLLQELVRLETAHPELRSPDSPTRRIGDAPVEHLVQVCALGSDAVDRQHLSPRRTESLF